MCNAPVSKSASTRPGRLQRGFTLIEVMIVVAIVAILAAVAIPSYRDYVLRGQLVDATTLLSTFRANMERYYQDNRKYTAVGAFVPPCDATIPVSQRTQGNFVLTCSAIADQTYTLTATGTGPTVGFAYTVDQQDNRTSTVGSSWPAPSPNTCWVVKRGQAC